MHQKHVALRISLIELVVGQLLIAKDFLMWVIAGKFVASLSFG